MVAVLRFFILFKFMKIQCDLIRIILKKGLKLTVGPGGPGGPVDPSSPSCP